MLCQAKMSGWLVVERQRAPSSTIQRPHRRQTTLFHKLL